MMNNKYTHLAWFVLASLLIQLLYGFATNQSIQVGEKVLPGANWLNSTWTFGLMWSIISVLVGVAGWLIYEELPSFNRNKALTAFAVQLGLNLFWSFAIFTLSSLGVAFFISFALWAAVAVTIFYAWHVNGYASLLLLPYFLWLCFSVSMNFTLWLMSFTPGL